MVKTLKKQWFVVLIAVIFIGFAIYCVYDTNKGKLPGKSVDGKDVVASLDGKTYITADDLYKNMYNTSGKSLVYLKFQSAVVDEAVKTTDEIKKAASAFKENLTNYLQNQASSQGGNIQDLTTNYIAQYGFAADEVDYYTRVVAKMNKLNDDYIKKHVGELFDPIYKKNNSRIVGHILVKMENPDKPTDAEKKKIKDIEDALAKGTSFEEVAKKYSDDTGSKEDGGYIGYLDKTSGFVDSFKNKSLAMKKGEISDWVKESNDNYKGMHMIKVYETDKDVILKDKKVKDSLYKAITEQSADLAKNYMAEAMKKLDIKYANDDIKKEILDTLGIKE